MTDPHDLDELASAHLDGTTPAGEAARIAADPELEARVAALQAVRDALREPVAADPDRREAAIAAALSAFDEEGTAPGGADRTVVALAPRRGLSPTALRVLGAAAAVALLALLVPLLATSGDDDAETSFQATGDALEGGAQDSGAEAAPDASTTTAPMETFGRQLGTYPTVDELLQAIETGNLVNDEAVAGAGGGDAPAAMEPTDCAPPGSTRSWTSLRRWWAGDLWWCWSRRTTAGAVTSSWSTPRPARCSSSACARRGAARQCG